MIKISEGVRDTIRYGLKQGKTDIEIQRLVAVAHRHNIALVDLRNYMVQERRQLARESEVDGGGLTRSIMHQLFEKGLKEHKSAGTRWYTYKGKRITPVRFMAMMGMTKDERAFN